MVTIETNIFCSSRVSRLSQLPALRPLKSKSPTSPRYSLTWDKYHPHATINEFIDELDTTYDFVRLVEQSNVFTLKDLKITFNYSKGPDCFNWKDSGRQRHEGYPDYQSWSRKT